MREYVFFGNSLKISDIQIQYTHSIRNASRRFLLDISSQKAAQSKVFYAIFKLYHEKNSGTNIFAQFNINIINIHFVHDIYMQMQSHALFLKLLLPKTFVSSFRNSRKLSIRISAHRSFN